MTTATPFASDQRLVDPFGRRIDYLRLSVVEQCNYRCGYCMPASGLEHGGRADRLSIDDSAALATAFVALGVRRFRLTGGEPLLRRDLERLAARIAAIPGVEDLSLSTNGELLAGRAASLRQAGVDRLNLSLDSLDDATFARLTGGGSLQRVVAGIDAAVAASFEPIKLNMVVLAGINDHEIGAMIHFASERGLTLRFIEAMPVGSGARVAIDHHLSLDAILERVRAVVGDALLPVVGGIGGGPARHFRVAGSDLTLGVISAVSRHFCASCNRVRLTAAGDLHLCLGQGERVALGELARAGAGQPAIESAIRQAIARKPFGHQFDAGATATEMSRIGG